jgi:hypothetical protein
MPQEKPREAPYIHPAVLQAGASPLWVCKGACDALGLLPRVYHASSRSLACRAGAGTGCARSWPLVFVLDADIVRQQQWRELARSAVLPAAAYGGHNDVNEAWVAGTLAVDTWCTPAEETVARLAVPADLYKAWEERVAIMLADGHLLPADAACLAWEGL